MSILLFLNYSHFSMPLHVNNLNLEEAIIEASATAKIKYCHANLKFTRNFFNPRLFCTEICADVQQNM